MDQRLRVQGQFDTERQFLLDNIILDGRYGYYVVTPLRLSDDNDVLLVNRGWIEKAGDKTDDGVAMARLQVETAFVTVHGRAGSLPRAGYRMGDAISHPVNGHFTPNKHFAFEAVAWYWHFVDVVWVGLYVFVYWM